MDGCCSKCNQIRVINRHHITYEPEVLTILCVFCHAMITSINTRYAKWKGKVKLSNEEREKLYEFFMATDKPILEAVLRKTDKTGKCRTMKTVERRTKKGKNKGKDNPLWRQDEANFISEVKHVFRAL